VLGDNNEARKAAEAVLASTKEQQPDKYAVYLTTIILDADAPVEIKTLCCVIMRRSLNSNLTDSKTLWETLNAHSKEYLKTNLILAIRSCQVKDLMHKLANLLVEVAGGM
jgi:hypothetical protein